MYPTSIHQLSLSLIHIYGRGVQKSKPEYEDLARLSRQTGLPLSELKRELNK